MYTFNVVLYMYVHKLFKLMLLPEIQNDENAIEESLDEFEENIFITLSCCRGISDPVSKSMLANFNDERFYQMLRISRDQFIKLFNILKDSEEFNKPHSRKQ